MPSIKKHIERKKHIEDAICSFLVFLTTPEQKKLTMDAIDASCLQFSRKTFYLLQTLRKMIIENIPLEDLTIMDTFLKNNDKEFDYVKENNDFNITSTAQINHLLKELKEINKIIKTSETIEKALHEVNNTGKTASALQMIAELECEVESLTENMEKAFVELSDDMMNGKEEKRLKTKLLPTLTECLQGGFTPNQLVMIAAYSGHGKTSLCLNLARDFIKSNYKVLYFSFEMKAKELLKRLITAEGHKYEDLKQTLSNGRPFKDLAKHENFYNIVYNDLPHIGNLTVSNVQNVDMICDLVRAMVSRKQVDVVFIDYIQQVQYGNDYQKKYETLSKITSKIKQLSLSVDVPIICAAQLNRESRKEQDSGKEVDLQQRYKPPGLHNLGDSSSLEKDSDIVLIWHPYLIEDEPEYNTGNANYRLKVAKNRGGITGRSINSQFLKQFQLIRESTDF